MKVLILCPNLASNAAGRTFVLSELLEPKADVIISGYSETGTIWPPIRDEISQKTVLFKSRSLISSMKRIFSQFRDTDFDILICSKPLLAGLAPSILLKRFRKMKLVLDIDDYELGFWLDDRGLPSPLLPRHLRDNWMTVLICEALISFSNQILVSNNRLREKFGGVIVPHARDQRVFNPGVVGEDGGGITDDPGKGPVMFLGTPRAHKGIKGTAMQFNDHFLLSNELWIIGASEETSTVMDQGRSELRPSVRIIGQVPFRDVPRYLSTASVIIVPQEKTLASEYQAPAKLIDAMAMGKPIVTTKVGPIPDIVGDAAVLCDDDNPETILAETASLLEDGARMQNLSRLARARFLERYSYEAVRPRLFSALDRLLDGSN